MNSSLPFARTRIALLVFFAAVGTFFLAFGLRSGVLNTVLVGAAFIVMGPFLFLQPMLLHVPLREIVPASMAAAIGPAWLRTALGIAALSFIVVGNVVLLVRL